jgi:hypothetical protein
MVSKLNSPFLFTQFPTNAFELFELNPTPVICLPSQYIDNFLNTLPETAPYNSFIQATCVTFLQAAGARVVPLILGEPKEKTAEKLSKCNGVLLPGGADDGYFDFGRTIFETVKSFNDQG